MKEEIDYDGINTEGNQACWVSVCHKCRCCGFELSGFHCEDEHGTYMVDLEDEVIFLCHRCYRDFIDYLVGYHNYPGDCDPYPRVWLHEYLSVRGRNTGSDLNKINKGEL